MLYVILAVVVLSGGVSTCNYAQRVRAESKTAACEVQMANDAAERAAANLEATEANDRRVRELQKKAADNQRALDVKYNTAKEELRALRNRKPVPVECVTHCDRDFAPIARVLDGMRGDDITNGNQGPPAP